MTWQPIDHDLATDLIGEGVHVGLRKGTEEPSSGPLWQAISNSSDMAWSDAVSYCIESLALIGYQICKEET